jgi:uncharacterized protein (TIGR02453 family)
MAAASPFNEEFFEFFRDLEANNEREWFAANKPRYQSEVLEPSFDFVSQVADQLAELSPHFVAVPSLVRGSVFRIYRDTRFAHDKAPYKTFQGIRFPHEMAKDVHAPGFYMHLEPGGVFVGAGAWHPDAKALKAFRNAIVKDGDGWRSVREDPGFGAHFQLEGDSLQRAPKGFDPDSPWIEDLRRKDFIGVCRLAESEALADGFVERFIDLCRAGSPLVRFLCGAVSAPF